VPTHVCAQCFDVCDLSVAALLLYAAAMLLCGIYYGRNAKPVAKVYGG
jgi:hypothetical protein